MPLFNSCCFCISLWQGAILSGIFTILTSAINIGLGIYFIIISQTSHDISQPTKFRDLLLGITYIIISLIVIIVSILLFFGVKNEKRAHLMPWLIVIGFRLILIVVAFIWAIFQMGHVFSLVSDGLHLILLVYCFLIVISYYQSIEPPYLRPVYMVPSYPQYEPQPQYKQLPTDSKLNDISY